MQPLSYRQRMNEVNDVPRLVVFNKRLVVLNAKHIGRRRPVEAYGLNIVSQILLPAPIRAMNRIGLRVRPERIYSHINM
jgi:hypothetical protein